MKEQIQDLEFWDKEKFRDRSLKIMGGPEIVSIPVPDDVIVCDFCNDQISEFPVAVYLGNALCRRCLKGLKKDIRKGRKNGL